MKKVFLTFADSGLSKSVNRICTQAQNLHLFDEVRGVDETDLDSEFVSKYRSHLKSHIRGFGYWIWKPQIILQTLADLDEGDIVSYVDAGCHVNAGGRSKLLEYFYETNLTKSGILAFQANTPDFWDGRKLPGYIDGDWTKGDLLDYFSVRSRKDVTDTFAIGAGIIFIRKCEASEKIIRAWKAVYESDYRLIDDTPSQSVNLPGFVEHRHDQPMLSILCKLNKVTTRSAYEYWYPDKDGISPDWESLKDYPIHAKRDLQRSRGSRFFRYSKKLFEIVKQRVS